MYVCIHVFVYSCIHVFMYVAYYVFLDVCMYFWIFMYACSCICMFEIYMFMYVCARVCLYMYVCMDVCKCRPICRPILALKHGSFTLTQCPSPKRSEHHHWDRDLAPTAPAPSPHWPSQCRMRAGRAQCQCWTQIRKDPWQWSSLAGMDQVWNFGVETVDNCMLLH